MCIMYSRYVYSTRALKGCSLGGVRTALTFPCNDSYRCGGGPFYPFGILFAGAINILPLLGLVRYPVYREKPLDPSSSYIV